MKTVLFCFGKFYFLLAVGDMLVQTVFGIPDSVYLVDSIASQYRLILKYLYIQYQYPHSQMIYPLKKGSILSFHIKGPWWPSGLEGLVSNQRLSSLCGFDSHK